MSHNMGEGKRFEALLTGLCLLKEFKPPASGFAGYPLWIKHYETCWLL